MNELYILCACRIRFSFLAWGLPQQGIKPKKCGKAYAWLEKGDVVNYLEPHPDKKKAEAGSVVVRDRDGRRWIVPIELLEMIQGET